MIQKLSDTKLSVFKFIYKISIKPRNKANYVERYLHDVENDVKRFSTRIKTIQIKYPRLNADTLVKLYTTAIYFRYNKRLIKAMFHVIVANLLIFTILLIPYFIPRLFDIHNNIWEYLLIYLSSFVLTFLSSTFILSGIEFIQNFSVKIGKLFSRLFEAIFIFTILSLIIYLKDLQPSFIKAILLSTYFIFVSVTIFNFFRVIIIETIIDAFYFSKKIQITDELILESSYRLSRINWLFAIKKKANRQLAINEVERLANLLENDWSNHILTGDEQTHKWKLNTLKGIANNLRKQKREIIFPSLETPDHLKKQFSFIFEKLLIHDLQGLYNEEDCSDLVIRKSKLKILQSILVAVLPLTLTLCLKYFSPGFIEDKTLHVTIVISGIWFLISVILWLDPNLADKLATVKSFKSMINQKDDSD